jgi:hypothetical protein
MEAVNEALYEKDAFEGKGAAVDPPSEDDMEMFKAQVSEWLKLDDQLRKLQVAVRERRVHQKALGSKIQEFMMKYGYDNLNTPQGGRIRSSVRTVRPALKLADIRQKLLELADQPLTGEEIIQRILDADRPVVVKHSLRRVVPKVSLHLDL